MNLARRILEGIHEVELQVTPEFRKEWPTPKMWQRTPVGPDSEGHTRYRVVFRWPDATIATGLELYKKGYGYELNVWAPGSTIESGSWAEAMGSIRKMSKYSGGIYVYVQNDRDPLSDEVAAASGKGGSITAYEVIDDKEPGEDPVVDHFLGYEGEPASVQQALAAPALQNISMGSSVAQGVMLSEVMKMAVVNRSWMHVVKINDDVTESNTVMVLVDNIPIDVAIQDKKRAVQDKFEGLVFETFWAGKIGAWKVWPEEGQHPGDFNTNLNYLVHRLDELVDAAEET